MKKKLFLNLKRGLFYFILQLLALVITPRTLLRPGANLPQLGGQTLVTIGLALVYHYRA
jgi:hypothetical protein